MKKLTIALLLTLSSSAFAQQNELVLAPAYVRYHAYSSRNLGYYVEDVNGNGAQLSLYYLRNIKWLQVGGGIEYGKLIPVDRETNKVQSSPPGAAAYRRAIVANPYFAGNIQVNYRHSLKLWAFHAGAAAGFMSCSSGVRWIVSSGGSAVGQDDVHYLLTGWYKGGQAGLAYKLLPNLSVSADLMARFSNLRRQNDAYISATEPHTPYNRLSMYNFSVGMHYKF